VASCDDGGTVEFAARKSRGSSVIAPRNFYSWRVGAACGRVLELLCWPFTA